VDEKKKIGVLFSASRWSHPAAGQKPAGGWEFSSQASLYVYMNICNCKYEYIKSS
jgi:hypothetical protein